MLWANEVFDPNQPDTISFNGLKIKAFYFMNKLKVMTVVGTRPEIIRLSRVIDMLDQHCDHVLVHTGQNYDYELNEIFFEDLDIRQPDFSTGGTTSAETIGNVFIAIDPLLIQLIRSVSCVGRHK